MTRVTQSLAGGTRWRDKGSRVFPGPAFPFVDAGDVSHAQHHRDVSNTCQPPGNRGKRLVMRRGLSAAFRFCVECSRSKRARGKRRRSQSRFNRRPLQPVTVPRHSDRAEPASTLNATDVAMPPSLTTYGLHCVSADNATPHESRQSHSEASDGGHHEREGGLVGAQVVVSEKRKAVIQHRESQAQSEQDKEGKATDESWYFITL